jgi:hypothetical protein
MKYIIYLVCLLTPLASPGAEDENRDFAIRVGAGAIQGIDNTVLPEISAYADMYLWSQSLRLIFGFSMYEASRVDIPTFSIQSIGIEQNFSLGTGEFFLGALYNKAYISKENSGFDPQRGASFQLGYKYPLQQYLDLVFTLGQQYQPFKIINNSSSIKLNDKTIFSRIAMQWYF